MRRPAGYYFFFSIVPPMVAPKPGPKNSGMSPAHLRCRLVTGYARVGLWACRPNPSSSDISDTFFEAPTFLPWFLYNFTRW